MSPPPTLRRRSRRSSWVRWVGFTLVGWILLVSWTGLRAQRAARSGAEELRSLSAIVEPSDADLDQLAVALRQGRERLVAAQERLGSPILLPLRALPFFGRQLASSRSLVSVALDTVISLEPLVEEARAAEANPEALDRVAFLNGLSRRLKLIQQTTNSPDLGPEENLVAPLAAARLELGDQLLELNGLSRRYEVITAGLASFLNGGSYLLLGTNNAEMRIGSGMHLSIGRLDTSDGEFELLDITPAADLAPVPGATVVDPSIERLWGFLDLETDFRKLGYSAQFDKFVGPQALELWRATQNEELDGVILIDPFVLEALVGVLGEVSVGGRSYGPDNLLNELLIGQYEELGQATVDENSQRRDRLALLAAATVEAFESTSWDPVELVRALGPVARGRHLMVYSVDAAEQAAWEQLGVAGTITGEETGIFWLNTGASKLDPHLRVQVEVSSTVTSSRRNLAFTVTTSNTATPGLAPYILGPWASLGISEAGTYRGRLAFYAPNDFADARFDSPTPVETFGPDGFVWLVSSRQIMIGPGETKVIRFQYSVDRSRESIRVLSSARFPAVQWSWDGVPFDDSESRTIDLAES